MSTILQRHHRILLLLAWLLASILLIFSINSWFARQFIRDSFQGFYHAQLSQNSVWVEQALENALILNDWEMVQKVVANLSQTQNTHRIRLLNSENIILASTIVLENNIHVDQNTSPCSTCHLSSEKPIAHLAQISESPEQGAYIIAAKGITNQIACQGCHDSSRETLGVILIEYQPTILDIWSKKLNIQLLGAVTLSGILLLSSVYFITTKIFIQPIENLHEKIIPVKSYEGDILIQITSHIDQIHSELLQARENIQFQRRGFTALLDLFESFNEQSTIQDLFQLSVYTIRNITGWNAVAMRLYDAKREAFDLIAQHGMTPRMVEELKSIPVTRGFQHEAFLTKKPVYSHNLAGDPRLGGPSPIESGYKSLVCIPLLAADRVVGSVELASKESHDLGEDELRWLELVGRSVGNLFSIVQMTDKLKSVAVIQERTRLSQEIHDGLAQLIGSLRMWAEDIQDSILDGDYESIQHNAEKIEQTARDAYASLREEMLELRDATNSGKDIIPVLSEYLNRFQRQSNIQTRLDIDTELTEMGALLLSPPAEIQLLRIIQEAVTNVRRHAKASQVVISLAKDNNWLKVSIRDDGIGFDFESIADDRLGLRIIRERSASIHGNAKIESSPGSGTEITVLIPMLTVKKEKTD